MIFLYLNREKSFRSMDLKLRSWHFRLFLFSRFQVSKTRENLNVWTQISIWNLFKMTFRFKFWQNSTSQSLNFKSGVWKTWLQTFKNQIPLLGKTRFFTSRREIWTSNFWKTQLWSKKFKLGGSLNFKTLKFLLELY